MKGEGACAPSLLSLGHDASGNVKVTLRFRARKSDWKTYGKTLLFYWADSWN
jgi:hypothetical protein